MFFIIAQKINNVFLQMNDVFTFKIGIIGCLFYLIIFIFIKSPLLYNINKNNWLLIGLFFGLLFIDTILICSEYVTKIKILEDEIKLNYNHSKNNYNIDNVDNLKDNNIIDIDNYETTTELMTSEE